MYNNNISSTNYVSTRDKSSSNVHANTGVGARGGGGGGGSKVGDYSYNNIIDGMHPPSI